MKSLKKHAMLNVICMWHGPNCYTTDEIPLPECVLHITKHKINNIHLECW